MNKTKVIVLMGLFIALNIVLSRLVKPIDTPFVRVSFGFLATSFSAILLGPIFGGLSAGLSDIIGFFMFPSPNPAPFFPGFTVSAILAGIIYGLFLKKKPDSIIRVILAVLTVSIFVDLGLNTLWLTILYKKAWIVLFSSRLLKTAIMFPVQVILIHLLWRYVGKVISRNYVNNNA